MEELLSILGIQDASIVIQISLAVFMLVQVFKAAGWTKIMPGATPDERMSRLTLAISLVMAVFFHADKLSGEAIVPIISSAMFSGLIASLFYRQIAKKFMGMFYAEDSLKGGQDVASG